MPIAPPLAPQIEQFIHDNPQGVMTSFRRNGMPQMSIVTVYPRDGGVGISITENRMKFKNLLRDPRCSVLISHVDWWSGFLVFEGQAELTPVTLTLMHSVRHADISSVPPPDDAARTGTSTTASRPRTSASPWCCDPSTCTAQPWPACARRWQSKPGRLEENENGLEPDPAAISPGSLKYSGLFTSSRGVRKDCRV